MAEASTSVATVDWSIITAVAIVICVVEEPVDDSTYTCADEIVTRDSKDAVSSNVGQLEEVVAESLANPGAP